MAICSKYIARFHTWNRPRLLLSAIHSYLSLDSKIFVKSWKESRGMITQLFTVWTTDMIKMRPNIRAILPDFEIYLGLPSPASYQKKNYCIHPAGTSKDSDKCDSIKRFWNSQNKKIAWWSMGIFTFSNIQPISVKIWGKYMYEKICKGMEIQPTLRHLEIQ